MRSIDKFVWLAVFASIVVAASPALIDFYLGREYGSDVPYNVDVQFKGLYDVIRGIGHLVPGIWLFFVSKERIASRIGWALFGVFVGFLAVAIFYLVSLYERSEHNQSVQSDQPSAGR